MIQYDQGRRIWLTSQQKAILRLMAQGLSAQEICGALSISWSVFKDHRSAIRNTLGLPAGSSAQEVLEAARQRKLI